MQQKCNKNQDLVCAFELLQSIKINLRPFKIWHKKIVYQKHIKSKEKYQLIVSLTHITDQKFQIALNSSMLGGNTSNKILTEKQIIKQLKILIAKQQKEINNLHEQVQKLKREKNLQSQSIKKFSSQKVSINSSVSNNGQQISSPFSTNRKDKCSELQSRNQNLLKEVKQIIYDFQQKFVEPLKSKYSYQDFPSNKQLDQKKRVLSNNSCTTTVNQYLHEQGMNSAEEFMQFFPVFLNQMKSLLKTMHKADSISKERIHQLQKKVQKHQKTLKQMVNQYEKNILRSQAIQNKLLSEISRLKQNEHNILNQNTGIQFNFYRKQLYDL